MIQLLIGVKLIVQFVGVNFHAEYNYLICDNCSQQLFPFTQLENDDFAQTLTNQEIIGNDFSKSTSLKLQIQILI